MDLGLFAPLERIVIESEVDEIQLDPSISIIPQANKNWYRCS